MTFLSPSLEDYLETILINSFRGKVVRVKDIVKSLNVKASSVIGAIKILSNKGLVNHEKYGYIELTAKGNIAAEKIYQKHQVLFNFFHKILGLDIRAAIKDACRVEHYIGEETVGKIAQLVEFTETLSPKKKDLWFSDFHNFIKKGSLNQKEITRKKGQKEEKKTMPLVFTLDKLKIGQKAAIIKINPKSVIKKQLLSMGVVPGIEIEVCKVAPLGDPIDIKIKGYHLSLRKEEAAHIEVEVLK